MIKAVIFDLDGVIVDTAKYHYLAWRKLANNLGFDISIEQNEQLKGVSRVVSLNKILDWGGVNLDQNQKNELLLSKNEVYLKYIKTLTTNDILPGIMQALNYLKKNNILISLGSASKNANIILERLEIKDKFNAIIDGNVVTHAKPDPEVFLKAANKLNILPKYCAVIEDAQAGVQAANSAGMISVGIGSKSNLNKADYVLESTAKLTQNFLNTLLKN